MRRVHRISSEVVIGQCYYARMLLLKAYLNAAKNIARAGHARLACGETPVSMKQELLAA